jgi:hypothetical protein
MRVGFSLGRCIRDIVNDVVDFDDVVVIVSGTRFSTNEELDRIVEEYTYRADYLEGLDLGQCQAMARMLFREGKIHQPRNFGIHRHHVIEKSVWADLIPTGGWDDPMVQEAWQAYRAMLGLTGNNVEDREVVEQQWKT